MSGNVWEWCHDWYGNYTSDSAIDPTGAQTGSYRVVRGGGWYYRKDYCRSAFRGNTATRYNTLSDTGFRVVRRADGLIY